MTHYTVTITNNETKQKQTYYCNGIVGSLLNANETSATSIIKFNCNILSALRTEVNLSRVLRKEITRILDRIGSGEFDIDDEASDVTFDSVKLAKGGD